MRMFARLQAELVEDDLAVMRRVLRQRRQCRAPAESRCSQASKCKPRRRRWPSATSLRKRRLSASSIRAASSLRKPGASCRPRLRPGANEFARSARRCNASRRRAAKRDRRRRCSTRRRSLTVKGCHRWPRCGSPVPIMPLNKDSLARTMEVTRAPVTAAQDRWHPPLMQPLCKPQKQPPAKFSHGRKSELKCCHPFRYLRNHDKQTAHVRESNADRSHSRDLRRHVRRSPA